MLVIRDAENGMDLWVASSKDVFELVKQDLMETAGFAYRAEILGWLHTAIRIVSDGKDSMPIEIMNGSNLEIWSVH